MRTRSSSSWLSVRFGYRYTRYLRNSKATELMRRQEKRIISNRSEYSRASILVSRKRSLSPTILKYLLTTAVIYCLILHVLNAVHRATTNINRSSLFRAVLFNL